MAVGDAEAWCRWQADSLGRYSRWSSADWHGVLAAVGHRRDRDDWVAAVISTGLHPMDGFDLIWRLIDAYEVSGEDNENLGSGGRSSVHSDWTLQVGWSQSRGASVTTDGGASWASIDEARSWASEVSDVEGGCRESNAAFWSFADRTLGDRLRDASRSVLAFRYPQVRRRFGWTVRSFLRSPVQSWRKWKNGEDV